MKPLYTWLNHRWLKNRSLDGKLNWIFALFFLVPVFGLIYFGIRYDLLTDRYLPVFFAFLLCFSFFGLTLLRRVFDDITRFARNLSHRIQTTFPGESESMAGLDELHQLERNFSVIDRQLELAQRALSQKKREIAFLKELADLCHVTADPDEILYVTLERALALTDSDVGSIMLMEPSKRKRFALRAAIGLGQWVKSDPYVDFEDSIAKYAVLNKAPLVVDDVEADSRFGRANRPFYGTKSFVCIPIKTSREIIGVMNISRKAKSTSYPRDAVDALEPLVSNMAFTYENLLLISGTRQKDLHLKTIAAIFDIIHSSIRGGEMVRTCLKEVRNLIPFEAAYLFKTEPGGDAEVVVQELMSFNPAIVIRGERFGVTQESVLGRVIQHPTLSVSTDSETLANDHQMEMSDDEAPRLVYLAPLRSAGGVSGILALVMSEDYSLPDLPPFLDWTARCLALILERNRLYDSVIRRNRELDSIRQIGGALASSTFDIRQVLNYTMEMIRVIMNVEAGALYLVAGGELEFAASFNIDAHQRIPVQLKLGQGIPGHVAARGETMVVNAGQEGARFIPQDDADKNFKVVSALCVPMISQGRVIGVIEVLNKTAGEFTRDDEDLLQSIASSVSIAVENANLYKETVTMAENERGIRQIFQKFVPKQVLERILRNAASGAELTEELKTLSLINVDIRGFSTLSRSLGPQKTVALLNSFFSLMGGIVFKHNGIVDKYLGDGFLALFGAPVSSTADADNAVNAALEMLASLAVLNAGQAEELGVELRIGISIHTGEVVVGNIGFDMKMDYTVIGDSVNDVFRIQDISRQFPNSIIFSASTLKASRMKLNYIELEEIVGEQKIYELLGKSH